MGLPTQTQRPWQLYATLDVPRTAQLGELKAAFRRKALRLHPDVCKQAGAQAAFLEVIHAWEVLGSPARRQEYDHQQAVLSEAEAWHSTGASPHPPSSHYQHEAGYMQNTAWAYEQAQQAGNRQAGHAAAASSSSSSNDAVSHFGYPLNSRRRQQAQSQAQPPAGRRLSTQRAHAASAPAGGSSAAASVAARSLAIGGRHTLVPQLRTLLLEQYGADIHDFLDLADAVAWIEQQEGGGDAVPADPLAGSIGGCGGTGAAGCGPPEARYGPWHPGQYTPLPYQPHQH